MMTNMGTLALQSANPIQQHSRKDVYLAQLYCEHAANLAANITSFYLSLSCKIY